MFSMINNVLKKIFGSSNDRYLKSLSPIVDEINALEPEMKKLSEEQLKGQTEKFRTLLKSGKTLDDILPEAFATVREAAFRVLGQRHYDVQLIGGIVLHQGKITEMKTGEGKTLVSTLAAYLNAIEGKGVHVVTVNDYLASRDAEWMGKIYNYLGLSVGCILGSQDQSEKQAAYKADITYGTNNEFGFDYLRDNMKFHLEEMAQREFNYAIIDEVDSILVDEARTPLIISGPVEDRTDLYVRIDKYIPKLAKEDYELDEKTKNVSFTEIGTDKIEKALQNDGVIAASSSLYDLENMTVVHHLNQALRAHTIFAKDKDYIVKDNRVIIIDEFTGRMMDGRRYSDGLHQALEAKENVAIQNENQTLASITFQNYFRLYPKLAGMTGTAMTEATEFNDIYKLEVVEVPTNIPVKRIDAEDVIYRTEEEKFEAMVKLITECNKNGQPVLAGTASIEKSELLSKHLNKNKIKHQVLNARQHENEAKIIAQAGRPGVVTVATNMAGRGTDIKLGGNEDLMIAEAIAGIEDEKEIKKISDKIRKQVEVDRQKVKDAGGLCVIGTERHESRRIDNQLRGRSGRQGDNGYSRFFLSSQDDLIRIFGADKKIDWVLGKMGVPGEPIEHPLITRMMEKSQTKVEQRNYEIRKNLLKFDDVMNDQRKIIYARRKEIMNAAQVVENVKTYIEDAVDALISTHIPEKAYIEQWDIEGLEKEIFRVFGIHLPVQDWAKEEGIADQEIFDRVLENLDKFIEGRDAEFGAQNLRDLEKRLLLFTLDEVWKEHLLFLDHLRQGINLRAYGQKDPLNEYKKEAFAAFQEMLVKLRDEFLSRLFHVQIHNGENIEKNLPKSQRKVVESRQDPADLANPYGTDKEPKTTIRSHVNPEQRDPANPATWGKVGRNDACPCGSTKKYKQCHGKL
jgi:preprotein translocase subunit SecA